MRGSTRSGGRRVREQRHRAARCGGERRIVVAAIESFAQRRDHGLDRFGFDRRDADAGVAREERAAVRRLGLDEDRGDVAAAAVEAMAAVRRHDRAAMLPPALAVVVHSKAAAHRERDLDRVVGMLLRAPGLAADPEAAAAPEQDAADADHRSRARRRDGGSRVRH